MLVALLYCTRLPSVVRGVSSCPRLSGRIGEHSERGEKAETALGENRRAHIESTLNGQQFGSKITCTKRSMQKLNVDTVLINYS